MVFLLLKFQCQTQLYLQPTTKLYLTDWNISFINDNALQHETLHSCSAPIHCDLKYAYETIISCTSKRIIKLI